MAGFPRQYRLVSLLVGTLLVAVLALVFMPMWLASRRQDMKSASIRGLYSIRDAEDLLAANDLDGNRVRDYWTRDIRGLALFRARGAAAGLIDELLAAADCAYPDARPIHGHLYRMHDMDSYGEPLANAAGMGDNFLVFSRSARFGDFKDIWALSSYRGHLHRGRDEGQPWNQLPAAPSQAGWGIVD